MKSFHGIVDQLILDAIHSQHLLELVCMGMPEVSMKSGDGSLDVL